MVLIPLFFSFGPLFETRYFPVIENFAITKIDNYDPVARTVDIYGTFDKTRQCTISEFNWYTGTPDRDFIRISNLRSQIGTDILLSHPEGKNYYGPWSLIVTPLGRFDFNVFALAIHHCHPLWNTITIIGPIDIRNLLPKETFAIEGFK